MSDSVLVTGAGGCIGSWVLRQLVSEGRNTVALDLNKDTRRAELLMSADELGSISWAQGDIADTGKLRSLIEQHNVNAIIHLAALQVPFCKANPRMGARVNVLGTVNVLESAREAGIKRIAHASSVAAHGVGDTPWLNSLYGAYKLCDEHVSQVYWNDWQVGSICIRPNVVYGVARDQGMTSLPTLAILAAVLEKNFNVPFTGTVGFLYAKEAAAAFIGAVAEDSVGASVFDLNGTATAVQKVLDITTDLCPKAILTCSGDPLPFPGDLSDTPLRNAVPTLKVWSIEDGVSETVDMFRGLVETGRLTEADLTPGNG